MRQCVLRCNHGNIHIARVRVLKWKCMLTMYSKNMWLYGNEIHGSYQVNYSQCQRTTAVSSWPHPWHVLVNLHIKAFVSAMSLPRACFLFLLRCCLPNFVLFLNVLVFPFFFFFRCVLLISIGWLTVWHHPRFSPLFKALTECVNQCNIYGVNVVITQFCRIPL